MEVREAFPPPERLPENRKKEIMAKSSEFCRRIAAMGSTLGARCRRKLVSEKGQGLTEYALLIGALAVVGVLAATVLRGPLTDLWNTIFETLKSITE